MFLIAFALGLREIERNPDGRIAILIGLALITAAMVPVYSLPGVGWLAITAGLWILAQLLRIRSEGGMADVRAIVRRSLPILIPAAIVLVIVFLTQLPKVIDFINSGSVGDVTHTNSKLRYVVSPLETLGIWPSGSWLLGTHDVAHFWLYGLIGLAALGFGLFWWIGRRDYAVPAAVLSGILIYLFTKYPQDGGLYILAKAVVVPGIGGDAARRHGAALAGRRLAEADLRRRLHRRWRRTPRSSPCATRWWRRTTASRSSPSSRARVAGQRVLALTSDRFTDYGLRTRRGLQPGIQLRDPGPLGGDQEPAAADRLRLGARRACSTSSRTRSPPAPIYQSQAPPGWTLVKSTPSYRLWKRTGTTPPIAILYEEARPGRVFAATGRSWRRSSARAARRSPGSRAPWSPSGSTGRPAARRRAAAREGWRRARAPRIDNNLAPGETASQTITLPPGPLEALAPVREPRDRDHGAGAGPRRAPARRAWMPRSPTGRTRAPTGRSARSTSTGRPVTVSVTADDVDWFQKLLGVDAPAVIGNLTAVNPAGFKRCRRPTPAASSSTTSSASAAHPDQAERQAQSQHGSSPKARRNPAASSPLPTLARHESRSRRAGVCRAAAGGRLRRGGPRGGRPRRRPAQDRRPRGGPQLHRGRPLRAARRARRKAHRHQPLSGPELVRRGDHLRPDPAHQLARARPELHGRRRHLAGGRPAEGPADRARVDHLPRHDARAAAADPGGVRARGRARLPPRLLAGANRSRAAPTTRSGPPRRSSAA